MGVYNRDFSIADCHLPFWRKARLVQIFLVLVVTVAVRAASCDPPPSGLIGWWPGDGNANDIIGTNNGVLMGGATANAPGVVGSAFQFDGTNGYVEIPDSPAFHPTNLTVEAWVLFRTLDTPAHGTYPGQDYIIFKQNSRSGNFEGIALEKDRYPPYVGTNDTFCWETSSASGTLVFLESVTTIKTNVWYYVAGVRGSNYIQLYVNGKLEAQASVSFPQNYGNKPLYFGTSGESYYDCKFGGLLDEVSLYNRALTSNEIAAIYAAGNAGKCRGLASSSTSFSLSTNLTTYGVSVTFTSTVSGSGPTPAGSVSFMSGTNLFGTALLNGSGMATFATNKLSVAGSPYSITAVYGGDINYLSSTSSPVALTITAAIVTPGVTVSDKTYDGSTNGTISSRSLNGVIGGDDVNLGTSGSAAFSDKNVGAGKVVTVTGLALSGTTSGDYQLSSTTASATANISAQPLTITAAANTKSYDGTTNAATAPVITSGSLQGTDTASFIETYDTKDVGTNKTLTPDGVVNDGYGGNDYSYTFVSNTNGIIVAQPLTITAVPNTKLYDGTTNAAAAPVISSGSLHGTDTAGFMETYDTQDVGTNKTLTPGGAANDGYNGNDYQITYVSTNAGIINPVTLTVTADNKTRWFGAANPALTAHFDGFVAGETTNVLAGDPDLNTVAAQNSTPGGYPITASLGTLSATNYTFAFVNGILTVLALPQLNAVGANESQFNFSFPTVSNQSYQVEYRTNLLLGTWLPLGSPIVGDGSPLVITNNINDPQGFFRLNLQP